MAYNFQNIRTGLQFRDDRIRNLIDCWLGYQSDDSLEVVTAEGYVDWALNHNAKENGDITLYNNCLLMVYGLDWWQACVVSVDDVVQAVKINKIDFAKLIVPPTP